jgi:hypothetical protein
MTPLRAVYTQNEGLKVQKEGREAQNGGLTVQKEGREAQNGGVEDRIGTPECLKASGLRFASP